MAEDGVRKDELWHVGHRLWPLPGMPWVMRQTWGDLLFVHYPVRLEVLRRLVPDVLPLDSFHGMGWVGMVLFEMSGVRLRGLPPIPGTHRFPQVNLRTYITIDGKPGVYFFNIDANNKMVANAAKLAHLPYNHKDINMSHSGQEINFQSRGNLEVSYRPVSLSKSTHAAKGSFEEWMAERYCFYTLNRQGVPLRCDILHQPWALQEAEAEIPRNTLLSKHGIETESDQPTFHFSKKMEVRVWPLLKASN
jgi:uncharacterized protein